MGVLPAVDTNIIFAKLESFTDCLKKDGKDKRLSALRNDLQYAHQLSTWFPKVIKRRELTGYSGVIKSWTKDPMSIIMDSNDFGLSCYTASCTFVVALCRTLMARIADRSSERDSFASVGPMAFIKDRKC